MNDFVRQKTDEWMEDLDKLVQVATIQPHCAYAAFTHSFVPKWNYMMRVMDFEPEELASNLLRLEKAIREKLLPKFTGRMPPGDIERDVFELPARLGGLNIMNPSKSSETKFYEASALSKPIMEKLLSGDPTLTGVHTAQLSQQKILKKVREDTLKQHRQQLLTQITDNDFSRSIELASEKGASNWLTVLPIEEHGFSLPKQAFRDAVSLRYNWEASNSPSHCVWAHIFHTARLIMPYWWISINQT